MGCYESNWVFNNSSKLHRRSFDYHTFCFSFSPRISLSAPRTLNSLWNTFVFEIGNSLSQKLLGFLSLRDNNAYHFGKWSQWLPWNQAKLKRVYHVISLGLHSELDSACNYTSAVKQFLTHFRCQGGQVQVAMLVVMVVVSCYEKNKSK